jgi:hypothetical protein
MYVFRRRQVKNHTRLAREELNESFGHLRMAAAHAADGAAGALAPRVEAARKTVTPTLTKARGVTVGSVDALLGAALQSQRDASRKSKKLAKKGKAKVAKATGQQKQRRWPMVLGGLLATGAVAGAASAVIKRRRARDAWDEYDSPTTRTTSDTGSELGSAKSTMDAGIDKVSAAAASAKERTSDLIGSKSDNPPPTPASLGVDKTDAPLADTRSSNGRP